MKVTEHIAVNLKGFRWLWQRDRGAMLLLAGHSLLDASRAYVPLYFSAKVSSTEGSTISTCKCALAAS